MSPKRKPSQEGRRQRKEERECLKNRTKRKELVLETAEIFTCLHEAVRDFTRQCESSLENLETDIVFNELAQEIWQNRSGNAELFYRLLEELLAERKRHQAAMSSLEKRFASFAKSVSHEQHLQPLEFYRTLTHQKLFPEELV